MSEASQRQFEVIISGSGPAGSAAAYFLAVRGVKVLVLEKEKLPRYKVCGGGVVSRVKKYLPFSIEEIADKIFFSTDIYDHQTGLHFVTCRKDPIIFMTMRKDLDYFLLSKALEAGAEVKDSHFVKEISLNRNSVEVETNFGNYYSNFLIAADGALGTASKFLGTGEKFIRLPAVENEVYVDENDFLKFNNSPRFDFGVINSGYGWVFPKKDHLSIGIVSMKNKRVNLNEELKKYLSKLGINKIQKNVRHGYLIPLYGAARTFAKKRVLLAGDAAGFADPVTAEGISNAILSGSLAAEAIMDKNFNENLAAEDFNHRIYNLILKEHSYANVISDLVYINPKVRQILFKLYGQSLSELITNIFTGEKKYSELMTSPVNYFKLIKYLFRREELISDQKLVKPLFNSD